MNDLEHYDDGFTIEEQKQLRLQYETSRPKIHVTERFQSQSADKLIAKLQMELGAANAYIEELETELRSNDLVAALLDEKNKWKKQYKLYKDTMTVKARTNELVQAKEQQIAELKKQIVEDVRIESLRETIVSLKAEIHQLRNVRDQLISRLSKYE